MDYSGVTAHFISVPGSTFTPGWEHDRLPVQLPPASPVSGAAVLEDSGLTANLAGTAALSRPASGESRTCLLLPGFLKELSSDFSKAK